MRWNKNGTCNIKEELIRVVRIRLLPNQLEILRLQLLNRHEDFPSRLLHRLHLLLALLTHQNSNRQQLNLVNPLKYSSNPSSPNFVEQNLTILSSTNNLPYSL